MVFRNTAGRDRAPQLIEGAEPYDLIILDKAHQTRREGAAGLEHFWVILLLTKVERQRPLLQQQRLDAQITKFKI